MTKEFITVTPAAAQHLQKIISDSNKAVRISIDTRGCAGHKYRYDIVDLSDKNPLDIEIHNDWGLLLLDNKSFMYLIGSTLDMKIEGLNSNLTWINPNTISTCGCGESFSLKSSGSCSQ